ncbi:isopentenyl-diphosphate Delta-isomerase [Tessaracoccus sp. ZS01]|uniref:isopentenyl-diphosphate Delta-isomerase n=1 Tax=Tessaracoccus sp. ZS01 TaxID=1906324 RepID=UPI00096ECCFF|nr:isopentenyl-diphosphate Delta-isomerase [Tessaracoccus sp. ZS01]MCG6567101.1 isopentenyl-diphosphate Delta-isomerase [Tessaracoccus sp. ZS01]OMG57505.1 isopentenyl-diphosphate delta-isomerase [Tessaracoccus sp. ZS01]
MSIHTSVQSTSSPSTPDEVILLDEAGRPVGSADRLAIHTDSTPLHLAFSTYLFNAAGQVLVTRRALSKKTWPGVWTNSACGHPRPGEQIEDAARRRIREEIGLHVGPLVSLLPQFRYQATDASGIVENEICPVFAAFVGDEDPVANPEEVAEWAWIDWADLHRAIEATPHVYSPWAALQVPEINTLFPGAHDLQHRSTADPDAAVAEVDQLIAAELNALGTEWGALIGDLGVDILADDLPQWLARLSSGGKRIRVRLAYWGFIAGGGAHGSESYLRLLRITAALELLHLFALIHDDVMDESDSRRGHPSAHVEAADWHRNSSAVGEARRFGESLAVLLGDLAHTVADRLVDGLPRRLRETWYRLSVELIAGQRADLTGAVAGRWDRHHAESVARLKSGRYTVMRPLQFGAIAAGASAEAEQALLACGELLGRAFALRDDYLGVWGDPRITGKPAGDDLVDAKATVLLSIARERLTGPSRDTLEALGTDGFARSDAPKLAQAMREAGVDVELEKLIADDLAAALAHLDDVGLAPAGVEGLHDAARAVAWRDA